VPFSHYPKIVGNIVLAWVQPRPPRRPGFLGMPAFDEMNLFDVPIAPGASVVGYCDAQPFTRFYGSIAGDQSLELEIAFSNDEVDRDGVWVTDDSIADLHYDAIALRRSYDPTQQARDGHFFATIYGRWLRAAIKNVGDAPTSILRAYVRGSVF